MSEFELDFGRITMCERVGTGITATVYRGIMDGNIEVAVKEIDWTKSSMGERQQLAFDREVAIMGRVHHKNLVAFHGVTSVQRPFRIITEFCGGGCAFELLHNNDDVELSWQQNHKMCLDVARAIEYLHGHDPQIIHRDLKSLNLLLAKPVEHEGSCPLVKVSDFGLSRMQDTAGNDGVWGKMTIAAGTCHWMAPEVFTGTKYNELADVYSYAMIMYEIICREIPFEEEEPANVGRLILKGQRPDLEAVPPDCPRFLRDLMQRGWAHEATARPPFTEIVAEMESHIKGMDWPRAWTD